MSPDVLERPLRVVVFCSPFPLPADTEFIARLRSHPEIDLVGGFCEGRARGTGARVVDLWRRRGALAGPILLAQGAATAIRLLLHPRRELAARRLAASVRREVEVVPDLHAPEILERVRRLEPDLGVIYGGPILRPELFEIPRWGTVGIHHGRLPEYRGKKTTFWEMYHGEETAGVTIQRVNAGLDTGEIVSQGSVPIGNRRYAKVWREVQERGVELYLDAILQVKRGTATVRPQPAGKRGKLYRDPGPREILGLWLRRPRGRLR